MSDPSLLEIHETDTLLEIHEGGRDALYLRGILLGATAPTEGQILSSQGGVAAWVDPDSLISGTYVDAAGDTMTGDLVFSGADVVPGADGTGELGRAGLRWGHGWLDALDVTNNANIGGDVVISGNLIVQGTSTQLETASLSVEDAIVEIGRGNDGSAPYVGAKAERGGGMDAFWVWNEAADRWGGYLSDDGLATAGALADLEIERLHAAELTGVLQTPVQPNVTTMEALALLAAQVTDFDAAVDDALDFTQINDGVGISWVYNDVAHTLTPTVTLAPFSTTELAEGANLYFTPERVDDRVAALVQDGIGVSWVYNDVAHTLTPAVTLAPFSTTELAEGVNLYFTSERVDDRVAALVQDGIGVSWVYDDGAGTLTPAVSLAAFDTGALAEGANLYFTSERVDDRVATLLEDAASGGFTWTYVDGAGTLTPALAITDVDVAAGAAIAVGKLAPGAARQVLQTNAAGTGAEWTDTLELPGGLYTGGGIQVAGIITSSQTTAGRLDLIDLGADAEERNWSIKSDEGLFEVVARGENGSYGSLLIRGERIGSDVAGLTLNATTTIAGGLQVLGGVLVLAGNIQHTNTDFAVTASTAPGSDTGSVSLGGGGSIATDRGAYLGLYGNEHSSFPGQVTLRPGPGASTRIGGGGNVFLEGLIRAQLGDGVTGALARYGGSEGNDYLQIDGSDDGLSYVANSITVMELSAAGDLQVDGGLEVGGDRVNLANLPTSAAGLDPGDLWNDAGTVKVA